MVDKMWIVTLYDYADYSPAGFAPGDGFYFRSEAAAKLWIQQSQLELVDGLNAIRSTRQVTISEEELRG